MARLGRLTVRRCASCLSAHGLRVLLSPGGLLRARGPPLRVCVPTTAGEEGNRYCVMTCRRSQAHRLRKRQQAHVQLRFVTNVVNEISNGMRRQSASFFERSGGVLIGVREGVSVCRVCSHNDQQWVAPLVLHLHGVLSRGPGVVLRMRPAGVHGHRELRRCVLRLDHLLSQHGGGWLTVRCMVDR